MSCSVTSVFTFKIESTFDEWVAIFDSEEADKRHAEYDIKPLHRRVSMQNLLKLLSLISLQSVELRDLIRLLILVHLILYANSLLHLLKQKREDTKQDNLALMLKAEDAKLAVVRV